MPSPSNDIYQIYIYLTGHIRVIRHFTMQVTKYKIKKLN